MVFAFGLRCPTTRIPILLFECFGKTPRHIEQNSLYRNCSAASFLVRADPRRGSRFAARSPISAVLSITLCISSSYPPGTQKRCALRHSALPSMHPLGIPRYDFRHARYALDRLSHNQHYLTVSTLNTFQPNGLSCSTSNTPHRCAHTPHSNRWSRIGIGLRPLPARCESNIRAAPERVCARSS